jgi:hypothetical protein
VVLVGPAQQPADVVERVLATAAAPGVLALDPTPNVVDGGESETHRMEGNQHPHGVGKAVRSAQAVPRWPRAVGLLRQYFPKGTGTPFRARVGHG